MSKGTAKKSRLLPRSFSKMSSPNEADSGQSDKVLVGKELVVVAEKENREQEGAAPGEDPNHLRGSEVLDSRDVIGEPVDHDEPDSS
jgi:hypothetical protein